LAIVVAIALGFCGGAYYGETHQKAETRVVHSVEYDVEYVEVPAVTEVPVTRPLKAFESLDELKAWLEGDDTDSTIYIFGEGCLNCYCCVDYATALMMNAYRDGYRVSVQFEKSHALNSAVIGDKIYFIEPQNDKVWLWGHRDCR
jgi:hypothetical protein